MPLSLDTLTMAVMSISEIIDELPKLSHSQRRELCQRIIDLEQERADIEICDQLAVEAFSELDRMETGDSDRDQTSPWLDLDGGSWHGGEGSALSPTHRFSC